MKRTDLLTKMDFLSKKSILALLMYWFLLIAPLITFSQTPKRTFKKIPIALDQVSYDLNIISIKQDLRGYLWMTTGEGLLKYDGYEFIRYLNIPGDSTSLISNMTESLFVDHAGDIWIGSNPGISRYKVDCDCFVQYSAPSSEAEPFGFITSIAGDEGNYLWFGMEDGGLFRYDRENETFTRFLDNPLDPNALAHDVVRQVLVDHHNNIWIGTGYGKMQNAGGLVRFNPATGTSKRFLNEPNNPNSLIDNRVSALLEDREGRILVGTYQNGLHYYNQQKDEIVRMKYNPDNPNQLHTSPGEKAWATSSFVTILYQDSKGGIWVGTCGGGINHFEPDTKKLTPYTHDITTTNGITNDKLWSFFEDRYGQFWLGNLTQGGLHKMNPYERDITRYTGANNTYVMQILESKKESGLIWLGTYTEGIKKMNLKTGKIVPFYNRDLQKHLLGGKSILDMLIDENDLLWLAFGELTTDDSKTEKSRTGALGRIDLRTGIFKSYDIPIGHQQDAIIGNLSSIYVDREGFLWMATNRKTIFRFDKKLEIFKVYELPGKKQPTLITEKLIIEQDSLGILWLGDPAGEGILFKFELENDKFIPFLEGYKPAFLYEDNDRGFWMGTIDKGLVYFSRDKSSFQQYTIADGLPSNRTSGILESPSGTYWVSTYKGISKFETGSQRFITNGLPSQRFDRAVLKASDGQLFFGGSGVLYSFFPDKVNGNPIPPEVLFTGLQISGQPYEWRQLAIDKPQKIILNHRQNDVSFEYVGLHYGNPSKNRYKYRLEPYDLDWIDGGTQRTARYTNLDSGEYNFRVLGSNENDIWDEKGAEVQFYIRRAWWSRWWAYLIYVTLSCSLVYAFYRFQLSKKLALEEGKRQKEVNQLKNILYTNISHEFRTPLTVILGITDELRSGIKKSALNGSKASLQMIRRNGQNLLQLVNQMLDLSKLESGASDLKLVQADMIPYVKYLCESFDSLAESSDLKLTLYSEIDSLWMDFDPQKLSIVLTNLLSNAIKFTASGGTIIVHLNQTFKNEKAYFFFKVKDNGFGIPEHEMAYVFNRFYQINSSTSRYGGGTGIGLSLTKEYVELMNGTIEVASIEGKGSEFTVQIPITRDADRFKDIILPTDFQKMDLSNIRKDLINTSNTSSELPLALIIEDNQDVAHYLQMCLDTKYQTIIAKDGLEGMEMAYKTIPDIIISDVMMPKKDGFEVCASLKSDSRTDHIPIILLTAKATSKDRLYGLSKGADAYLPKPFHKEELFIRIDKLISVRKKLIEKIQKEGFDQFLHKRQSGPENLFLHKLITIIHEEMGNHYFGTTLLAERMHLSESQIYRKLKATTGKSTAIFIRSVRLQKAKELIRKGESTISEIAYDVGFNDPSWFSRAFKEEFGFTPSETL